MTQSKFILKFILVTSSDFLSASYKKLYREVILISSRYSAKESALTRTDKAVLFLHFPCTFLNNHEL